MKMETIKNYLDSMFANLPNTPSVLRAKEELLQMMEDKYEELRNEGKTENEAVGNVIAEFGNLTELAEALGVEEEVKRQNEQAEEEGEVRVIGTEEAGGYIRMKAGQAVYTALGIAVCILSVICPILVDEFLADHYEVFGAAGMFLIAGAGVILIVLGSLRKADWKYIRSEKCTLSMDATKYVKNELNRSEMGNTVMMIVGILLCAGSWIPAGILDNFMTYDTSVGGAILFFMIAIGVFLIVYSNVSKDGYTNLLKLNAKGSMKEEYTEADENGRPKKAEDHYDNPVVDFIMSVYWPTVTCLYLIISFVTFRWGVSWVLWPVAGIIHSILRKSLRSSDTI